MSEAQRARLNQEALEELYATYNRRCRVHPDPVEFLYRYDGIRDREIAGLIASALAFGRVEQILKSVSLVLERMGVSPFDFVRQASPESMRSGFRGFRHRFAAQDDLVALLGGVRRVLERRGSLERCFILGSREAHDTTLPALSSFAGELARSGSGVPNALLPRPKRGSACKRLNLFLRWMVRHDDVDPGGWEAVSPSKLIVPLDTHMHRLSLALGLTRRRQADMRTALEITRAFRAIAPDDPVRYDFCLTRLGIRDDADIRGFLEHSQVVGVA